MQFYYGEQNYLRVLDEVEFWKRQEAEHTTVIEQIVTNLETSTIETLSAFRHEFTQTENETVQLIETVIRAKGKVDYAMKQHIMDFIGYTIQESEEFIKFLNDLLAGNQPFLSQLEQVVVKHIIRESEYFIGIAQTILFTANK